MSPSSAGRFSICQTAQARWLNDWDVVLLVARRLPDRIPVRTGQWGIWLFHIGDATSRTEKVMTTSPYLGYITSKINYYN